MRLLRPAPTAIAAAPIGHDGAVADPSERATRIAYDVVAVDCERLLRDELAGSVADRDVLARFADEVHARGGGTVAVVGCGPGRITGHLHGLGLEVVGLDLSPAMVHVGRSRHPHLSFVAGSMAALPFPAGALAAVVAWYSIIHTVPARHRSLFAELRRVLRPDGSLVLAFQVGDESLRLEHAYGHDIALDVHRLDPDRVAADLAGAGFTDVGVTVRDPIGRERQPQAYVRAARGAR